MSDVAIRVEGLGKKYSLGGVRQSYSTLRDQLRKWTSLRGLLRRANRAEQRPPFWALRDLSFEVKQGEVVGIIGRNGAGKSTLLKILSRITEPTEGEVDICGRVGSLLEVGTGFHPELTGRENVFLNGAILGMTRREIARKFDEIAAFAEVERFLDTPVKHYSSGMYTRLAFAVAAHLEPEILIVDEVLAVGDAEFQHKCLGKMSEVAKSGRTVLFVSHNMTSVRRLCNRALLLVSGRVTYDGDVDGALAVYQSNRQMTFKMPIATRTEREGTGRVRVTSFQISGSDEVEPTVVRAGERVTFRLKCRPQVPSDQLSGVIACVAIKDAEQRYLMLFRSNFSGQYLSVGPGESVIECRVDDLPLAEGDYTIELFLSHRETEILDFLSDAIDLRVDPGDYFGTGSPGLPSHCRILTRSDWRVA